MCGSAGKDERRRRRGRARRSLPSPAAPLPTRMGWAGPGPGGELLSWVSESLDQLAARVTRPVGYPSHSARLFGASASIGAGRRPRRGAYTGHLRVRAPPSPRSPSSSPRRAKYSEPQAIAYTARTAAAVHASPLPPPPPRFEVFRVRPPPPTQRRRPAPHEEPKCAAATAATATAAAAAMWGRSHQASENGR